MNDATTYIEFAKAYSALGWAVQEQVDTILEFGQVDPGSLSESDWDDFSCRLNSNAVEMINQQLVPALEELGATDAAEELVTAIDAWQHGADEFEYAERNLRGE
jgi:hypothetical protein